MLLAFALVWCTLLSTYRTESLADNAEDAHHGIWEREVKKSAERASALKGFADSSSFLLNDVKAYYRLMLSSDLASEEADNSPSMDSDADSTEQSFYYQPDSNVYWINPAPPFNPKPVHSAPSYNDAGFQVRIPARYLVMFQGRTTKHHLTRTIAAMEEVTRLSDRKIRATDFTTTFEHVAKGFTATLNSAAVVALRHHPLVEFIEEDQVVHRSDWSFDVPSVQWNLDRLDQRSGLLDGKYNPSKDGTGIDIYILDTGIRYDHSDFNGRARYAGMDSIDELTGSELRGGDCNGHGTHCAGIASGEIHGVAKGANIYSLRVLGCSGKGAVSGIVMGIDYIIGKSKGESNRKVMGLSLDLKQSRSLNGAVEAAAAENIPSVVASGNQGLDSCLYSPSSAPSAISVAATNLQDIAMPFSNSGKCVDLFAPGAEITSAGYDCSSCERKKSGTSMAAPHVLGACAILLQEHKNLSPAELKQKLIDNSSKGVVDFSRLPQGLASDTPNRLLFITSN